MSRLSSPVPEMDEETRRIVESIDIRDDGEIVFIKENVQNDQQSIINFDEHIIMLPWTMQSTRIDENGSKIKVVGVEFNSDNNDNITEHFNNKVLNLNNPNDSNNIVIAEHTELKTAIVIDTSDNKGISCTEKVRKNMQDSPVANNENEECFGEDSEYIPSENESNSGEDTIRSDDNVEEENLNEDPQCSYRKRPRNEIECSRNKRKTNREKGEEYINTKGKKMPKKNVKGQCSPHCTFLCMQKFPPEDRKMLHDQFWKLTDTKKHHYFSKYTERKNTSRKRTLREISRKCYTHIYYFELEAGKVRVCKNFFLGTLDISQQRIYYFFKKIQNKSTQVPRSPMKGKHRKTFTSNEKITEIKNHIKSFPTVESHYCRANSKKLYLDPSLNISRMYSLYKLKVNEPVSESMYRKIFNTQFNLDFYKPKKDRCDKCEELKAIKQPTPEQVTDNEHHLKRKLEGKNERTKDREGNNVAGDEVVAVVVFDLENVFSLPKCEISSFFYKQKLNVYNLTAHCNVNKVIYNCIWNEALSGRAGNDIASALVKILKKIVTDVPQLTKLILWSDSCVPQNKNSIMSTAIKYFLKSSDSKNLTTIEQKFSEPGHGNLQEVDAAHSVIERYIRRLEIFSPLGLVRCLLKIPKNKLEFKVIQMQKNDFFNYQIASASLKYSLIPYTKVKHIIYKTDEIWNLSYRLSFSDEIKTTNLLKVKTKKNNDLPKLSLQKPGQLKEDKKKHLKEALKFMQDQQDINFYTAILKI